MNSGRSLMLSGYLPSQSSQTGYGNIQVASSNAASPTTVAWPTARSCWLPQRASAVDLLRLGELPFLAHLRNALHRDSEIDGDVCEANGPTPAQGSQFLARWWQQEWQLPAVATCSNCR